MLCGVRDVRDYRIHSSSQNAVIAGGSAFNVKAESLRLGDFSEDEVRALLSNTLRRPVSRSRPRPWIPYGDRRGASRGW